MPDQKTPGPPTIEQLAAIFAASHKASIEITDSGEFLTFSVRVSNRALGEAGYSFITSPEGVRKALAEALARLRHIEATEKQYERGRPGATVADCIAVLHKLREGLPRDTVETTIHGAILAATIAHLNELNLRREAAVAKSEEQRRREEQLWEQRAKREEARRKQEFEETLRGFREAMSREEAKRRAEEQAKEEQARKAREQFSNNNASSEPWEEFFRAWENSRSGFGYDSFGWSSFRRTGSAKDNQQKGKPKAQRGKRPWHEVLGISPTATKDQIKSAVRALRSRYHPDRCKDADATEKMVEVNVAHDEAMAGF